MIPRRPGLHGPVRRRVRRALGVSAAAGLVLTTCTHGTLPLDASSPSSPASRPPTSLATSSPPLRAPTTLEARCFRMDPRIARIRVLVERFRSSARSTARIARLHVAARRLAGERLVRSDLARRGAFVGGDECLARAASAEALTGVTLGPTTSPEIRWAAEFYTLLLEFFPRSPRAAEAQNYLLSEGFAVPSPTA